MTQTAQTYGEALYELARDEQTDGEILEQLLAVSQLFRENPQYVELLSLPSVPKWERCDILDACFHGQIHPYLLNFLKILVENGTVRQLPGCEEAYRRHYYEAHGILEVTAVTAVPLSDALQQKLQAKLEAHTGKTVRLCTQVEPGVLGGIRLEMAGKRLDGTVRSRLDELQACLRETVL